MIKNDFFLGITSFTVDPNSEQVTLETTLSTRQVQNLLETSGRTAILRGLGPAGKGYMYTTLSNKNYAVL